MSDKSKTAQGQKQNLKGIRNMFKKFGLLIIIATLVAIISSCSSTVKSPIENPSTSTPYLFSHTEDEIQLSTQSLQLLSSLKTQAGVTNLKKVKVQLDLLKTDKTINFNVLPDVDILLSKDSVDERTTDDYTWFAKDEDGQNDVILVVQGDDVVGTIHSGKNMYRIQPIGDDLHAVMIMDTSQLKDHPPENDELEGQAHEEENEATFTTLALADSEDLQPNFGQDEELIQPMPEDESLELSSTEVETLSEELEDLNPTFQDLVETQGNDLRTQDTGLIIDVIVAYTAAAKAQAGNINALIQLAIDETNMSYQNSGVTPRVRLVHRYQTNYNESGSMGTDLSRFRGNGDGHMDEIHGLRSQKRADVAILITNSGGYCGLATTVKASSAQAFAVVHQNCATGYYSFGHEIGHLQGAHHNPQVATNSAFSYGHGFYNTTANWRTVMSYDCPGGCTRKPYWSNPYRSYGSSAMGTTTVSHNVRVLNKTAYSVANFLGGGKSDYIWWGKTNKTFTSTNTKVVGLYTPISGDFNGDGEGDIFWYRPGKAKDYIWWGKTDKTFLGTSTNVYGTYTPISGDFNGDGRSDILWYRPGSGKDYIWWGNFNKTFTSSNTKVNGTYEPFSGDFNGDGRDDVFWYRPGKWKDYIWWGNFNKTFTSTSLNVSGSYTPISGDFNGDGEGDIFWYRLGSLKDYIWWGKTNKTFSSTSTNVYGTYNPISGDFNGDGRGDIFWYRAGGLSDPIWWGNLNNTFSGSSTNVRGDYKPISGDFNGDGEGDIFWYRPGK